MPTPVEINQAYRRKTYLNSVGLTNKRSSILVEYSQKISFYDKKKLLKISFFSYSMQGQNYQSDLRSVRLHISLVLSPRVEYWFTHTKDVLYTSFNYQQQIWGYITVIPLKQGISFLNEMFLLFLDNVAQISQGKHCYASKKFSATLEILRNCSPSR